MPFRSGPDRKLLNRNWLRGRVWQGFPSAASGAGGGAAAAERERRGAAPGGAGGAGEMEGMPSLEELQAQLERAQAQKSAVRLAERNVVELVLKIQELGLLPEPLLHTVTGREFLTRERLEEEVARGVARRGGRLALVDLPPALGVDLVHCERAARAYVAASRGAVEEIQGELLSQQYFDEVAVEVRELLQQQGRVGLGELALRYNISAEMAGREVGKRVGPGRAIPSGRLEGGLLYTEAYIGRLRAQLRGALRGAAAPAGVKDLCARLGLDEASRAFVAPLLEELAAGGAALGEVKGGGFLWTPAVYTRTQHDGIREAFKRSGYVGFASLKKQGIPGDPVKVLEGLLGPEARLLRLDSVCASEEIVTRAEAAVEEALTSGGWCEAGAAMPPDFSPQDAALVLEQCLSAQSGRGSRAGTVLCGTCFVSKAFLERCQGALVEHAEGAAQASLAERAASRAGSGVASPKGGSSKPPPAAQAPGGGDDEEDDDWSLGGGKKKGKKKGKGGASRGGTPKGGGGGKNGGKQKQVTPASQGPAAPAPPGTGELAKALRDAFPELKGVEGGTGNLSEAIAGQLRPAAWSAFKAALQAVFTQGAEKRKKLQDSLVQKIKDAYSQLYLHFIGVKKLSQIDSDLGLSLTKHLLRSFGPAGVDSVLRSAALAEVASGSGQGEDANPAISAEGPLSDVDRKSLLRELSNSDPIDAVLKSLARATDVDEFINLLETAAQSCCDVRLKALDKKSEKNMVRELRARMAEEAEACLDSAALLALAVPLLYSKVGPPPQPPRPSAATPPSPSPNPTPSPATPPPLTMLFYSLQFTNGKFYIWYNRMVHMVQT